MLHNEDANDMFLIFAMVGMLLLSNDVGKYETPYVLCYKTFIKVGRK